MILRITSPVQLDGTVKEICKDAVLVNRGIDLTSHHRYVHYRFPDQSTAEVAKGKIDALNLGFTTSLAPTS